MELDISWLIIFIKIYEIHPYYDIETGNVVYLLK
ncbi:hypothetical protein DFQ02_106254 [Seonamhaeicola aphaedonensis]|uniref:Uncharacterized protein n=1 Tax=Seonamhaeicola aphaedonensis TaxID=1461338 RepID=A0A3D9HDS9_9FLAO|nr:hypothetical protein DFQ02_106254 [Seonamhaeicola aphaedonensis]